MKKEIAPPENVNTIKVYSSLAGFSLTEMVMVLIVIAILVAAGVPAYRKAVLIAEGKGAVANLIAIQTAQKVFFLEEDAYRPCADMADCNTELNLDMFPDNYTYQVTTAAADTQFTATANGEGGACTYTVSEGDDKPAFGGVCNYRYE